MNLPYFRTCKRSLVAIVIVTCQKKIKLIVKVILDCTSSCSSILTSNFERSERNCHIRSFVHIGSAFGMRATSRIGFNWFGNSQYKLIWLFNGPNHLIESDCERILFQNSVKHTGFHELYIKGIKKLKPLNMELTNIWPYNLTSSNKFCLGLSAKKHYKSTSFNSSFSSTSF